MVGATVVPVCTYPAGAPPMVTVGVYVAIDAAALDADAAADAVPDVAPDTDGVLIVGSLGTVTDGTDELDTVGAEIEGLDIVGTFGSNGTAL